MYSIIYGNTEKNAIITLQKLSYEYVNLSSSRNIHLEDFTLAVFKATKRLSMDNKSIRYLGEAPFFRLMHLKHLDLSHNQQSRVDSC